MLNPGILDCVVQGADILNVRVDVKVSPLAVAQLMDDVPAVACKRRGGNHCVIPDIGKVHFAVGTDTCRGNVRTPLDTNRGEANVLADLVCQGLNTLAQFMSKVFVFHGAPLRCWR